MKNNTQLSLISVVIPVYNVGDYIDKCLESISGQTYRNLQIVVVNDGSTDPSRDIVGRHAAADPRIEIVDKPNGGLTFARRDGIAHSRGEFVFFIDGDDYIGHGCIEELHRAVTETGCDIAAAQLVRVRESYASMNLFEQPGCMETRQYISALLANRNVTVAGKLYRRELWDGIEYYEKISLGEDFVLNLQIALHSGLRSVCFCESAYYFYVQRSGSLIRGRNSFQYLEYFMDVVSGIVRNSGMYEQLRIEAMGERVRRYYSYIKRNRSPWAGDTALSVELRREVAENRRELKVYVPSHMLRGVMHYRYKAFKRLVTFRATMGRISDSLKRRTGRRTDAAKLFEAQNNRI